ncbi:hypothetical protein PMIN06_001158 [Paraphaeosphaeria minitans]
MMTSVISLERLFGLSAADSAGAFIARTISTNLHTIKQLIRTDTDNHGTMIAAKFIQSVHLLASYREMFSEVLNPGKQSPQFILIWNDRTLTWKHNALNSQCIALEDALQRAFRNCLEAKALSREQRLRMELAMLEQAMSLKAAHSRFYGIWRLWKLLRFG